MAENTYTVGYSTNARAKCKYSGCEKPIAKDDIRFSKSSASAFSERPKCEYYHAKCMFMSFVRARKTTKKIESMNDIEGVDSLKATDKESIKKFLKEWKSGSMKDQVPKITRKRKADDDEADDQKKKKKTKKETSKSSKKTTRKTKDSDDEEEEEEEEDEYKPKKSRKVTKSDEDEEEEPKQKSHLISKKTETKKPKEDSDDDEEDEDDEKFDRILKGKSASSNQKKQIDLDSDKSEDEKKAPTPKQPPPKTTNKKRKSESDEEVKESESSAEDEEENSDKFLSGKIIATVGKLSMPREKIIELIEKNGGKYAKTITKDVTHVICAKKDDKTQKLQKAKELGKIIVTESFLKRGQ